MVFVKRRSYTELRKSPRKLLRYPCVIIPMSGSSPTNCMLCDISASGARLALKDTTDIPALFTLVIGRAKRQCRVMWRNTTQMGVLFIVGSGDVGG
jgi:hypothetical protein